LKRLACGAIAVMVFAGDQFSKSWVAAHYNEGMAVPVAAPAVYLYPTTNDGVAWSLFPGHAGLFSFVAVLFTVALVIVGRAAMRQSWLLATAMGLLIGGSLGNLADRLRMNYVRDFIDVHLGNWYRWPTFNLADSAITVGMLLLAGYFWLMEARDPPPERPAAPLSADLSTGAGLEGRRLEQEMAGPSGR
jgi:signal peptidase II